MNFRKLCGSTVTWQRGAEAADPAGSPLREGPAGVSEGSEATSGEGEHLQQVTGSFVCGEGAEGQEAGRGDQAGGTEVTCTRVTTTEQGQSFQIDK